MAGQAIAIDLGGTKTSWALISESYEIADRHEIPTPKSAPGIIDALRKIIAETLTTGTDVRGVAIGVAGLVDSESGVIVASPNLPLGGASLGKAIQSDIPVDCAIDNDANLAVLGELYQGAGRGRQLFIGLTVGTGVGGGIVSNGRLWRGAHGTAAEFGHMVIEVDGIPCPCGNRGCFEQMASGTALERLGREFVVAQPDSDLGLVFDRNPSNVRGRAMAQAARDGNTDALAIFRKFGRSLGIGIGNLINIFNPEIVVLGGGVASSLDLALDTVKRELQTAVIDPRAKKTPVVISSLHNTAGLIGAAGLVLDK